MLSDQLSLAPSHHSLWKALILGGHNWFFNHLKKSSLLKELTYTTEARAAFVRSKFLRGNL